MSKYEGYDELAFSYAVKGNNEADNIIKEMVDVVNASCTSEYGDRSAVKKFSMDGKTYRERERDSRLKALEFAGAVAGVKTIETKKDLAMAFNNTQFRDIINSIVSETLVGVIINNTNQIFSLCNIDNVGIGDTKTYSIEPKGLPVAQRTSYTSNVTFLEGYNPSSITVTPRPYTTGATIDYIRMIDPDFDWGKEIGRVAMSLLYAQYLLVTGILFDTANVTNTPFFQPTFLGGNYVRMIDNLRAVNNTEVAAYGTRTAYFDQGALVTNNAGYQAQDDFIRNGRLGQAYGINNMVIDQATDLSAPFTDANMASLLLVPNDRLLLISNVGDKPVKLVRENFVRVLNRDQNSGSQYRIEYSYTMAFDAGYITQGHYAIQMV